MSGAWMDRVRISHAQLGAAIPEELEKSYAVAQSTYLSLKQNFESIGDYEGASWAYRKERRMEKKKNWAAGAYALRELHRIVPRRFLKAGGDQLIELVCDYGESFWRAMACVAAVWLVFALTYGLSGNVLAPSSPGAATIGASTAQQGTNYIPTRNPLHWLVFSLATMVTIELPALVASSEPWMSVLMPLQAFIGIFLAGLLGFVAGNRIRRS